MAGFDSKFIGQPGNLKAIDYLEKMYASFGYKPDVQWFTTVRGGGASAPEDGERRGDASRHCQS